MKKKIRRQKVNAQQPVTKPLEPNYKTRYTEYVRQALLIPTLIRAGEALQILNGSEAQLYTMHNKQQTNRWKGLTS